MSMSSNKVLVINPKNTSTRIAIYRNLKLVFLKNIKHKDEEFNSFKSIYEQKDYRTKIVINELKDNGIKLELVQAVVARGGLIKPVTSGIYEVNDKMKEDLKKGVMGLHASNLGGLIASDLAKLIKVKAYIADPVVVDELDDVARISGHPLFERKSVFHALSHKVVSRKYAKSINKKYEELNLIVVHVGGGGISVGAHKKGHVIDINQAFDGGGPFSLERTGSLPVGDLVRLCFSGKYKEEEISRMITQEGGLMAYLGTKNIYEIQEKLDEGDEKAAFIMYAMAYQVAKEIGSMYTVLEGDVNAIILAGDLFHNKTFVNHITKRIDKIAHITVYPDEDEMEALNINAQMVLMGEAEVLEYK